MVVHLTLCDYDYLRRHPVRSANEGLSFAQGSCNLRWNAEIGQFDFPSVGEEDVGSFDISVHFPHGVEVDQTL